MTTRNSQDRSVRPVMTKAEAREKLRQRILEIVNRKFHLTDADIWRESAPDYLPWAAMLKEIRALDQDKQLRLEIVKPGHWVIHSLEAPKAEVSEPV